MFRYQLARLGVIDAPYRLDILAAAAEFVGVYLSVMIDAASQGVRHNNRLRLVRYELAVITILVEAGSHIRADVLLAPCNGSHKLNAFHADALEIVVRVCHRRHA